MGKWKSKFDANTEPEAAGGDFETYEGPPLPLTGVFWFKLELLKMKQNSKGDDMMNGLLVAEMPSNHHAAEYNGAPLWFNLNQTDQGAPYTKAFLDALGVSWKDFNTLTILDSDVDPPAITRLGKLKIVRGAIRVKVSVSAGKTNSEYPEPKPQPRKWMALSEDDQQQLVDFPPGAKKGKKKAKAADDEDEAPAGKKAKKGKKAKPAEDEPPF